MKKIKITEGQLKKIKESKKYNLGVKHYLVFDGTSYYVTDEDEVSNDSDLEIIKMGMGNVAFDKLNAMADEMNLDNLYENNSVDKLKHYLVFDGTSYYVTDEDEVNDDSDLEIIKTGVGNVAFDKLNAMADEMNLDNLYENKGVVLVDKDADVNTVKKYTDKDIKVALVDDSDLNENNSGGFSVDKLKSLGSLKDRLSYCQNNLKKIDSGSSRIVYELPDNNYVLKLAKNQHGFKQNKTEAIQNSKKHTLLAQVVDFGEDGDTVPFVIMEKASPINENEFKKLTGVDIKHMDIVGDTATNPDEFFELMNKKYSGNQFLKSLEHLVDDGGLGRGIADFIVLSSYGKVKRGGKDTIVIIDYGYSEESVHDYHGDDVEKTIAKMGYEDSYDDFLYEGKKVTKVKLSEEQFKKYLSFLKENNLNG